MGSSLEIAREIVAAGWGPEDPCPECIEVLKRPATPGGLSALDVIGIHWRQVVIHLARRFGTDRKLSDAEWGCVERTAFLHVMRTVPVKGTLTTERLEIAFRTVGEWYQERYLPASRRLDDALRLAHDETWWREHGPEYEPAFTDSLLTHDQRFGDLEYDLRALALARAMHEEDSITPKQRIPSTVDELIAHVELLDDYTLWRFTKSGQIRLDPKKVKTGLDGTLGRMQQSTEEELGVAQDVEEAFQVLDALAAKEDIERVRKIIDARTAEVRPGSARHVVLTSFFEILRGDVTYNALSRRSGLSDSSIQEAFVAERKAIARALRAA